MPVIHTIDDPSGAVIAIDEKANNPWAKHLVVSFKGLCIFPDLRDQHRDNTREYKSSIKIKSPTELSSYLDQIIQPELFDLLQSNQNNETPDDLVFRKFLALAPHRRSAGMIGIYNNIAYIAGNSGSYDPTYRVVLDTPADTIHSLNAFLRDYV